MTDGAAGSRGSAAPNAGASLRGLAIRWLSDNGVFSPARLATLIPLLSRVHNEAVEDAADRPSQAEHRARAYRREMGITDDDGDPGTPSPSWDALLAERNQLRVERDSLLQSCDNLTRRIGEAAETAREEEREACAQQMDDLGRKDAARELRHFQPTRPSQST